MSGERREEWPPERDRDRMDPVSAPTRWERTVASIVRAAGPELRRRAAPPGVAGLIGRWARPLVAAAAALIVAASAALFWPGGGGSDGAARVAGTDDAGAAAGPAAPALRSGGPNAGLETAVYPAPVGPWMSDREAQPTVEEIVFSASAGPERP